MTPKIKEELLKIALAMREARRYEKKEPRLTSNAGQEPNETTGGEDARETDSQAIVEKRQEQRFVILGAPQGSALPMARILGLEIVREIPVTTLVRRLRASARRLCRVMRRWCNDAKSDYGGRIMGEMVKWCTGEKDGFVEKRILMNGDVVACWNELCSRMTHLKIRDFGGMPVTMFGEHLGGEAHIDISHGDIESDDSAEALVERMMLKHASNQLWLHWHALYSSEKMYISKKEYMKCKGLENQFGLENPFIEEPNESDISVRAGYAASGVPVFEFVAETEFGNAGVFRWRAIRDDGDAFGVGRGIVKEFPRELEVTTHF